MPEPLPTRLKLTVARWIGGHAGTVCAWAAEVEHAANLSLYPPCPDCAMPEPECYCDEKADERHQYDAAYTAGFWDAEDLYRKSAAS